jgi:hypothetical protein
MRLVLIALLVTGCRVDDRRGGDDGVYDSGADGPGRLGEPCKLDSGCAEGVCANGTHVCTDRAQVRDVKTTWTLRGAPATPQTCAAAPNLEIAFYRTEVDFAGFSPVPCSLGQFVIIHLPYLYNEVGLAGIGKPRGVRMPIPDADEVMFDLDL